MKQRNFLSHIFGLVERELEATLAVLILLAGVVGYTLAGTETVAPALTAQEAATTTSFTMGGKAYSTLTFSSLSGYKVRNIAIPAGSPTDISNATSGLVGETSGANYLAKVNLGAAYTGPAYLLGDFTSATINGISVTKGAPANLVSASSITLGFQGGAVIKAISTTATATSVTPPVIGTVWLTPSAVDSMETGTSRKFAVFVADSTGSSINPSNLQIAWTVSPSGSATITSDGVLTAIKADSLKVTVTVSANGNSKTASATVTAVAPEVITPQPITYPGADEDNEAIKTPVAITTPTTDNATDKPQNSWGSAWGEGGYFSATPEPSTNSVLEELSKIIASPAEAATQTETVTAAKMATALYAPSVIAKRVEATGKTIATQAEVRAVVAAQPTVAARITARMNIAASEMRQTFKEILFGDPAKGKDNAINLFAKSIRNLFGGAGASPTDAVIPSDDFN